MSVSLDDIRCKNQKCLQEIGLLITVNTNRWSATAPKYCPDDKKDGQENEKTNHIGVVCVERIININTCPNREYEEQENEK